MQDFLGRRNHGAARAVDAGMMDKGMSLPFADSRRSTLRRRSIPALLAGSLLACFCLLSSVTAAFAGKPVIVIDPGHGGHDIGANNSLVYEKHINLDVSRRLKRTLEDAGYRVVMTRETDRYVPLSTRAEIANRLRNALFVSVHFNSSWKRKVSGIETYYRGSTSKAFATYVQNQMIRHIRATDRGVKTANFAVLRRTRHPAVLIEGGFVSNSTERSAMLDPKYRQVVADSIARGLMDFNRRR